MEIYVDSCPQNITDILESSARLGCGQDKYGNDQFLCVPNTDKTGLIELCYNGIMGIVKRGNCLETDGANLYWSNCTGFLSGCPEKEYRSNEIYQYSACQIINAQHNCYLAESSCPNITLNTTSSNTTSCVPVIVGSLAAALVILAVILKLAVLRWRRKKSQNNGTQELRFNFKDDEAKELLLEKVDETSDQVQLIRVGDYNTWKTGLSDQFSTLSNDEVLVLFCFLCSDSGPPDFTDTEWLDLINKIRQLAYGKENPVTREEAQQTLDRLKSRDYLWEDQDKITEDTKDETMYRIASIHIGVPFCYSSYDTASVYLRSSRYNRKPGEKCVSCVHRILDDLLIPRLQMNILTHVTMEDTEIYDEIHLILNIPVNNIMSSKDKREEFLNDLKKEGESVNSRNRTRNSVDHVTWLWRYTYDARPDIVRSCIGLHPHWDIYIIDNKAYRKPSKYHSYQPVVRCLLYCLLFIEKYQLNLNEKSHRTTMEKIRDQYFPMVTAGSSVDMPGEITETHNDVIIFKSDDIRHDVMYAFVTECMVEDSDLEFLLTTASRDLISEYCRSWEYKRNEGERCLCVPDEPEEMYDLFIDKLQLDIITHCTVSDRGIQARIRKRLNIPQEVFGWDIHARERFVKNSKLGSEKMFRARGMIVGCAGAGKTTLLRKLHGRGITDEDEPTLTTIGLEVHEDLFAIKENKLTDFANADNSRNPYLDNNVIGMTDFAGQVAYYACHQVYLSRRAFYIVVIDMSKNLDEESRLNDTDRHDPTGSLFHSWTYGEYFQFWLQTINTYCNDGITQKDPIKTTAIKDSMPNVNLHPVILIASHKDQLQDGTCNTSESFYSQLEACLSKEQTLKRLISPYRYFEVECPPGALTQKQQMTIDHVKKSIVETVQNLPHWGEEVPLKWFELEKILNNEKANGKKVIKRSQLRETAKYISIDEDDLNDVLRFLHEIGKILYFSVDKLKDTIIIDVQWFVDAFKYIITDKKHFARNDHVNVLVNTGKITGQYIKEIWKNIHGNRDVPCADTKVSVKTDRHHDSLWQSYLNHKDEILQYMDKLGLMTRIEGHVHVGTDDEEMYYIPSMNRIDLSDDSKDEIRGQNKSVMMVYFFKSYLPHFFFFRLVVKCLGNWKVCDENSFFKNAALYKAEEAGHYFSIAVSKTSIQLQIFTREETVQLDEKCVKNIRQTVEYFIQEITETFHRGIIYDIGFSCSDIKITDEDEDFFLKETDIKQEIGNSNEIICPKHFRGSYKHKIDAGKIRMCLLERMYTSFLSDN